MGWFRGVQTWRSPRAPISGDVTTRPDASISRLRRISPKRRTRECTLDTSLLFEPAPGVATFPEVPLPAKCYYVIVAAQTERRRGATGRATPEYKRAPLLDGSNYLRSRGVRDQTVSSSRLKGTRAESSGPRGRLPPRRGLSLTRLPRRLCVRP